MRGLQWLHLEAVSGGKKLSSSLASQPKRVYLLRREAVRLSQEFTKSGEASRGVVCAKQLFRGALAATGPTLRSPFYSQPLPSPGWRWVAAPATRCVGRSSRTQRRAFLLIAGPLLGASSRTETMIETPPHRDIVVPAVSFLWCSAVTSGLPGAEGSPIICASRTNQFAEGDRLHPRHDHPLARRTSISPA